MPADKPQREDEHEIRVNISGMGSLTTNFKFENDNPQTANRIVEEHGRLGSESYTTCTGKLPIKAKIKGEDIKANIFFVAYLMDGKEAKERPLMFVFNGGPGSSSVWLHLGALGPRRVKMQQEGWMPNPPYTLEENEATWLHDFDLVFIDPVGTGYSRAEKPEDNAKFWNIHADIDSLGDFIRRFLNKYERWESPLFLCGESYGTTRAAGLAGHLFNMGVALNGLVLISPVLNFQTLRFTQGNDLPYALYLPSFAATNWYHDVSDADDSVKRVRVPDEDSEERELIIQNNTEKLRSFVEELRSFVAEDYTQALMQGEKVDPTPIKDKLKDYTGLNEDYLQQSNWRINIQRFCKELLRHEGLTVGRLDSRFKGVDDVVVAEFPEFDPSYSAIVPPFTAMFNQFVRVELGYEEPDDEEYQILSFDVNRNWTFDEGVFPDTSKALHDAMKQNPYMHLFVAMGYYDLATPFYAIEYTLEHSGLQSTIDRHKKTGESADASPDRIHKKYYEAGHMVYLHEPSLEQLKKDIVEFRTAAFVTEES